MILFNLSVGKAEQIRTNKMFSQLRATVQEVELQQPVTVNNVTVLQH